MATIAGSVKSLSTGVFNVKDENGNVRALKVGDEIYENDTVYGENGNTSSSQVEIQLSGNDVIVLNAGQKQLIDSSLIETAFGTEELFFTREALDLKADNYNSNADVVSDLRDAEFTSEKKESEQDGAFADANNADATKEETAEGEEEVEDETAGTGEFQARTGAATDINSDLRNAQFKARTQVFEDKSAFENESKDRLTSLTNTDRPSYTTPSVIQITPSTPPVQQVVTPPPAAPIIVIGNLSVNDITQYESEGFLIFTVTLDRPVASPVTFDYKTSPITASPNGKDYTDVFGKITIPAGSTSVTIKVPITDDYVSDNGETIKITITNVVGNATITKPEGIGTILDNPVNNPGNGTPNTPKEPGGYGEEDTVYAVIVGPGTVNEGNITTDYTVKLIDKDGNPVIVTKDTNVTVKYLNIDTEDNDTQYKNNDKITVTIKAGTSSNTFKVETKDDYISDNNEKYNLSIEKVNTNEFENVVIGDKTGNFKDVTTTILDNSKPDGNTPHDPNEPPKNVEKDAEIVQIKLVALYENGTPVLDSNGNYTFANSVNEGNTAKYMALAFAPGETVFSPSTKLVDQLGTVDVTFGNDTAIGIGSQTKTDGSEDFNNTAQAKVALGTVITTATYDDWKADNGETFTISITNKSYAADASGGYENVIIDTKVVTTTILDDSRGTPATSENPAVPHNPNVPPVEGTPPTPKHPETNHEIVQIKLVACDKDGKPIMDGDSYTFENKTPEGNKAFYMAIAFEPGATTYTKETKLADADQLGSVTVSTKDLTTTTDAKAGDDYTSISTQKVNLNTAFSVDTLDDYIADNGEKYEVVIDAISYDPNKIGQTNQKGYENVSISGKVTTTILDDTDTTPNNKFDDPEKPNEGSTTVPKDPTDKPREETQEQVILKIVACDANGKPIMAGADDKTYTFINTVAEGNEANYMVLAFKPGTTTFTTDNLASVQGGTVTIQTADSTIGKIATGIATQTLTDGTQDYQITEKTVIVGTAFNVKTFDDFMSDNDETYTVLIKDATYAHPTDKPLYENVTTDSSVVTTTIKDDTGTPNTSDDGVETTHEAVIIKLIALDKDGNPIIIDGKYTFINTVAEGNVAKYKALAFAPTETEFKNGSELEIQAGTVTVTSRDTNPVDAKGTTETTVNKNDNDGSKDYVISTQTVELGTVITVATLDDYVADNGEKYEVALNTGSYTAPAGGDVYENVAINTDPVTTTITDDTDTTPNNPSDTPKENDAEQVILKIVACDASGNPIMTGAGGKEYTFENGVNEGIGAKYMVLAFKPGTTVFTTDNVLANDKQGGTVTIKTANDSATGVTTQTKNDGTQDYILETTKEVTVGTSFTVTTLNDFIVDDGEKYTVAINDGTYKHPTTPIYENVKTDSGIVTTTITDDPQNATIVLVAVDSATTTIADITDTDGKLIIAKTNSTPESGKLYYMAVAIDKTTGKPLDTQSGKVTATTYDNSATGGTTPTPPIDGSEDYGHINKQVDIGKVFEVQTNDDYLAEGNENYTVIITAPVAPVYENAVIDTTNNTVTSTITDNPAKVKQPTDESNTDTPTDGSYDSTDTVYVKITENDSVFEGNTLKHIVTLVDKNGTAITVPAGETITVTFTYSPNTTEDADYKDSTKTMSVTIVGEKSGTTVENITIDDFFTDGVENYTITITDVAQAKGTYENVAIHPTLNWVTGEIKDGVTPGIPVNAYVDEDKFIERDTNHNVTKINTSITDTKSLGIIADPLDNTYVLNFDSVITVYKGKPNPDGTTGTLDAFKYVDNSTVLKSGGEEIQYQVIGNKITGYIGANEGTNVVPAGKKVFEITLDKNAAGGSDDSYTYTQFKNIDHPKAGINTDSSNDDDITFEFGFRITDGTAIGNEQKSDVINFKVTVNDSMPFGKTQTIVVDEDQENGQLIVISAESFENNKIAINNGKETKTLDMTEAGKTIDILDQYSINGVKIGTLTNNGDGTVTFTPNVDYSGPTGGFTYTGVKDADGDSASATVNISVKPKSDAPTIADGGAETWEDTNVTINLKAPVVKDNADQSTVAGDYPEKLGLISLSNMDSGVKILDGSNNPLWTSGGTESKLYILLSDGEHTQDTIDTFTADSNHITMTKAQFEALKVDPVAQSHKDIDIKMSVTEYEVDASGNKLLDSATVGTNGSTTEKTFHVEVKAVTDDISLTFTEKLNEADEISNGGKTYTITNNLTEGAAAINLNAILSATSGNSADLDGSEKRTYEITGIPEGTIITLGTKTVTAKLVDGVVKATIAFSDTDNKLVDPNFEMKLPEHFGGKVTATITLTVKDTDSDSSGFDIDTKTEVVTFIVNVNPVADVATIQVSQAVGFEDAGRTNSNNENAKDVDVTKKADYIDAPQNGIPLDIKVTSADKDGSETFNVTISDIPDGGAIYYKGGLYNENGFVIGSGTNVAGVSVDSTGTGWALNIVTYDNATPPQFIPPHNEKGKFILKVDAVTVDKADGLATSTQTVATTKNIEVIVKDVADIPVGTELKPLVDGYVYKGVESTLDGVSNQISFQDFYLSTNPKVDLKSYDASETLSIAIDLPDGFSFKMSGDGVYEIQNNSYVFKASDVDKVKIVTPVHFSGEADIKITYITTDVSDSKTHAPQTVKIYVEPTPDDIDVTSIKTSTIIEDAISNKLNFEVDRIDADGSETITHVKISKASIDAADKFAFYLDAGMTTNISTKATETIDGVVYYVLTYDEAKNVYAKNTTPNLADKNNNFTLDVKYTVQDTAMKNGVADTKTTDFAHTHTVNVQAVTDTPDITVTSITNDTASVSIVGTTVTVSENNSVFTVRVNSTSEDKDGSEQVQRIEIHGVPKGVTIDGASFQGTTGANGSGIWVLNSADKTLDSDGAFTDIKFTVHEDSDFTARDITIKTFIKDIDADERTDFVNITLKDYHSGTTGSTATTPKYELTALTPEVKEDTPLTLDKFYSVASSEGNHVGSSWAVTITNLPTGAKIEALPGATISTIYVKDGKTHYVISGTNAQPSDIKSVFEKIQITPPENMNTGGDINGKLTMLATISSTNGAASHQGTTVPQDLTILPITDDMKITVEAAHTNEDEPTNLKITLSNPSDGTKAALVGNSVTIKVIEDWKDSDVGVGAKGNLTDPTGTYDITTSDNITYTITPKAGKPAFAIDSVINGLVYTPASNRDGNVKFEVTVQNIENHTHAPHESGTKTSKGEVSVNVTPVIDVKNLSDIKITATSTEDTVVGTLKNAVRLDIKNATDATLITDGSEKMGNIILDGVPNGFVVYYKDGANLVMATNIGKIADSTFDLNPNIITEDATFRNKWLIPNGAGGIPEVYINAPENWSGDFGFNANFTITEQNLGVSESFVVSVAGKITPVADGITIDPTLTFGKAFDWVDLKLNANMVDVDGSETMSLKITGLDAMAQFKLANGTLFDGLSGHPTANYTTGTSTWEIKGVTYDQINNIQFAHDKSVANVGVIANTVEKVNAGEGPATDPIANFELKLSDVSGTFKLDAGLSLDFSKIDNISTLKNINEIDLGKSNGKNELLNLSLQDVLDMSGSSKEIKILGDNQDKVTLNATDWKVDTAETGFNVYSNSDNTVKVKVEQAITDQII